MQDAQGDVFHVPQFNMGPHREKWFGAEGTMTAEKANRLIEDAAKKDQIPAESTELFRFFCS